MECYLCHRTFDEAAAEAACRGCLSGGGCRKIRCPHCGGEMPREPRSATWLRRLFGHLSSAIPQHRTRSREETHHDQRQG